MDWGARDEVTGRPCGLCCWTCTDVFAKLRPGETLEECVAKYENSKDTAFKEMVDAAHEKADGLNAPPFHPGTMVSHDNYYGFELYQEFGAVTAVEYKALTGVDPTTLQNKTPFPMKWAGPSTQPQNLYLLGLDGLSPTQLASVRKVRLRFCNGVLSSDQYLTPEFQLDADQPKFVLDHVFNEKFIPQRPLNPIGSAPESVAALQEMQQREQRAVEAASLAAAAVEAEAAEDGDGWEADEDEYKASKGGKLPASKVAPVHQRPKPKPNASSKEPRPRLRLQVMPNRPHHWPRPLATTWRRRLWKRSPPQAEAALPQRRAKQQAWTQRWHAWQRRSLEPQSVWRT